MTPRQVDIAVLAVQRGFITPETFGEAMRLLAERNGDVSDEDLWGGRLSGAQLAELRAAVVARSRSIATLAYGAKPAPPDPALRHTDVDKGPKVAPPPVSPPPGGRYQPITAIAEGGVGEVYECLDLEFGRRVAMKLLRRDAAEDAHKSAMLSHEARITGNLEHPNIIPVYDLGSHGDGRPYYVMRLVEQPTLADAIDRLRAGDPAATAEYGLHRLLRVFIQVCQAVDYAHSRNVLHCDLKPANILLGSFGEVLVADWGLASEIDQGMRFRGGTLGYMAPEQVLASTSPGSSLDRRTDVFALGAILYEILTLRPVYGEMSLSTAIGTVHRGIESWPPPDDPRRAAQGRAVPEELAEICLKAMQARPSDRHATAREMASAVEAFLEGTRERERRLARAKELVAQAEQLTQTYHDFVESRFETLDEMSAARDRTATWDPAERKQELWDIEERLAVMDALSIRTLQAAVSTFEQALDEHPGFEPARRGLARLYRGELRRAQDRHDAYGVVYFQELVRSYEGAEIVSGGESAVTIASTLPAEVTLQQLEERGRRWVPTRERALGTTPIETLTLSPGSYLATFRRDGLPPVRAPLFVRVGAPARLEVDLTEGETLRPGEVLIPGGAALLQRDEAGLERGGLVEVEVPSFVIGERPVSFAEYLEFLAERYRDDPAAADPFLPRTLDGVPLWRRSAQGELEPAAISRWSTDRDELLRFPAFGIDALSAEIYAAWHGARIGFPCRLPTEQEWEKAARGTDGRSYPWGDHFDASFCKMRESRPGLPHPEPIGAFAHDVSPYGVRDLAGGVAEWVVPLGGARLTLGGVLILATRGGAWPDPPADCRAGARRTYLAVERSARIGFRLARTVKRRAR